jgi:hypothetical protein
MTREFQDSTTRACELAKSYSSFALESAGSGRALSPVMACISQPAGVWGFDLPGLPS